MTRSTTTAGATISSLNTNGGAITLNVGAASAVNGIISGAGLISQPRDTFTSLILAGRHPFAGTLVVGSGFDYGSNAILYCAAHMPEPRAPGYAEAVADELVALISAAGGRTLALFTSWRAMNAAVEAVTPRVSLCFSGRH